MRLNETADETGRSPIGPIGIIMILDDIDAIRYQNDTEQGSDGWGRKDGFDLLWVSSRSI